MNNKAESKRFFRWLKTYHPTAKVKHGNKLISHYREGVESGLY